MRINSVYAELETTKNSIHEQVIPFRRSFSDNKVNNLHIPDKMDPISPNFVYRDSDWIAKDPQKRGGGLYGKGFVNFFTADQSLTQARFKLNQMISAGWFDEKKTLSTSVELMFYNDDITQGIINTYQFFSTNNGDIISSKSTRMYLPENYNFKQERKKSMSMSKLSTIILLAICITIDMFTHTLLLSKKVRSMMMHRINEFQFRDFIVLLQIAIFILLFIYGGSLFGEQMAGKSIFKLPIRTEKTFQHWVRWSQRFMTFRTLLGASAIFQCLNFLLVASNAIPSLGILFETLSRAKRNLFYFTMLVLLVFVCSVVSCYILFGSNKETFSTFSESVITNFQMVFGDVNYTALYEANKQASATFFSIFVCVFCFFIMNIYSAIIIGTYQKVRLQKLMLSAAMMRIIGNNAKTKFFNWLNLITFQKSKSVNINQRRDSQDDGQIQLTKRQIFWKNWAIITHKQIETKEQFVANLENTAKQIQREKEETQEKQQERLQGNHDESINSESSFKILKRSVAFICYIIISLVFFLNSTNNREKHEVFQPIYKYLHEPYQRYKTSVKQKIKLATVENFDQLTQYLNITTDNFDVYRGFGFSYPVGDTFARLNFRFYNQQLNHNLDTAAIFPAHITPQQLKTDISTIRTTYDEKLYSYLGSQLNFNPEFTRDLILPEGKHAYIKPGDPLLTVLGSGGYSFSFNRDKREKNTNMTVSETIEDFASEQENNPFAMINFEMLVYTPNYSLFTYIVLEFIFKPSGELDSAIFSYSDNPKNRLKWQQITLFTVWLAFSVYYMILLIRKLGTQWQNITKEQNKDKQPIKRTRCSESLLWIGIDNEQLKNTNPVAMIVLAIVMIIKHMIMSFIKFIRSVLRYCGIKIFNIFDILITYMTIQVIVQYVVLIYQAYKIPDFGQLEQASKMATFYMNYLYNVGITMVFLFLKSLEIFQFSTSSNLIVSVVSSGYGDILNYIVIYMILLFGEATAAYIVFGSEMPEFRSVQASIYSILKMLNGNFLVVSMQQTNPIFATMFFVYVLIVHWVLLLNIFIGLIKGNYLEEQKKIQNGRDQEGVLKVIWRILSNQWIKNYREERAKLKKANEGDNNDASKKGGEVAEEELPIIYWAFGWPFPHCAVVCLNSWLDPDNERIEKLPSSQGRKEEKIRDEADGDDQEIQQESLEQMEHTEGNEKNDEVMNTPYKLDADYIVDKGIKPYLQNFDELFDLVQKSQKHQQDEDVKVKKEIQKIANNPQVMKLKEQWNLTTAQDKPVADANFWLHHLDENILNLTKRQTVLQDFRCFDQFFSELLVQKKTVMTKFQTFVIDSMHYKESYQKLLLKIATEPDAFLLEDFKNRFIDQKNVTRQISKVDRLYVFETVMNYKYFAWKAIDRIKRQKVFENLLQSQKEADEVKIESNSVLQIVHILENESNLSMSEKNIVLPALEVLMEKEFTFDQQCASFWRRPELNMVPQDLRIVWRNLSLEEKYELWYNRFDARERVRLWNSLVFQLNWFERVVEVSKGEKKTHPPFRADIKLEIERIKKQRTESSDKYAQKHNIRCLSAQEKDLRKYLSYGPAQLRVLWNILFKMWPTQSQVKQVENGRKTDVVGDRDEVLPRDQRRNFEGGSEEDSAGIEDPKARQASSTGAGSAGQRIESDDPQKSDHDWRDNKHTKAQDALQRFDQVQYFFKNMHNFMITELKKIQEEENNNEPSQSENDPSFAFNSKPKKDCFQRQFKHFQTIVKKLQPDEFNQNLPAEEQRLQLWILLTKREKFDMLFHQVVEYEAQMMSFLLEAEHGEMGIDTSINQINDLDNEMESALNQQIFRKYIAFTRLQATRKSKAYFQQREKTALDYDVDIIRYCSFLKERYTKSDMEIKWLKTAYEEKEEQLKKLLAHIKAIAEGKMLKEEKIQYKIDDQIIEQCKVFNKLMQGNA